MKGAAEDVDVTFEDQQKVNKCAQNTSGIRAEGRNRCKKDTTPTWKVLVRTSCNAQCHLTTVVASQPFSKRSTRNVRRCKENVQEPDALEPSSAGAAVLKVQFI